MFVVWAYFFVVTWEIFGFRVVIEIVYRHMVPRVIDTSWNSIRQRPQQKASSFG